MATGGKEVGALGAAGVESVEPANKGAHLHRGFTGKAVEDAVMAGPFCSMGVVLRSRMRCTRATLRSDTRSMAFSAARDAVAALSSASFNAAAAFAILSCAATFTALALA